MPKFGKNIKNFNTDTGLFQNPTKKVMPTISFIDYINKKKGPRTYGILQKNRQENNVFGLQGINFPSGYGMQAYEVLPTKKNPYFKGVLGGKGYIPVGENTKISLGGEGVIGSGKFSPRVGFTHKFHEGGELPEHSHPHAPDESIQKTSINPRPVEGYGPNYNIYGTLGPEWWKDFSDERRLDEPYIGSYYSTGKKFGNVDLKNLSKKQQFALLMNTRGSTKEGFSLANYNPETASEEDVTNYNLAKQAYDDNIKLLDHPYYIQNATKFWGSEEEALKNIEKMKHRMLVTRLNIGNKAGETMSAPGIGPYLGVHSGIDQTDKERNIRTGLISTSPDYESDKELQNTLRHEYWHAATVGRPEFNWTREDQTGGSNPLLPEFKKIEELGLRNVGLDWTDWGGNPSLPIKERSESGTGKYYRPTSWATYLSRPSEYIARTHGNIKHNMINDDFNWNEKSGEEIVEYLQNLNTEEAKDILQYNNLRVDPALDFSTAILASQKEKQDFENLSKREQKKVIRQAKKDGDIYNANWNIGENPEEYILKQYIKTRFTDDDQENYIDEEGNMYDTYPMHKFGTAKKISDIVQPGEREWYEKNKLEWEEKLQKLKDKIKEEMPLDRNKDGIPDYTVPYDTQSNDPKFTPNPRFIETLFHDYVQESDRDSEERVTSAKYGGTISSGKAREILHDGTVHGNPITDKQRRFFGAMSNKKYGGRAYPPPPYYPYKGEELRVNRNYDKTHVQPTAFRCGGSLNLGSFKKH